MLHREKSFQRSAYANFGSDLKVDISAFDASVKIQQQLHSVIGTLVMKSKPAPSKVDVATNAKMKSFRLKASLAKEHEAEQRKQEALRRRVTKEAKSRIGVVVMFGEGNTVSLVIPVSEERKTLRHHLKKRYPRITSAKLVFPDGEEITISYKQKVKAE